MISSSRKAPIPHENGPEPLDAILQKTTRIPLYCHPKTWSDTHLDILRVQGLEKTYSLEHVIGRPVTCDPSDTDLRTVIDEITPPLTRKPPPGRVCNLGAFLDHYFDYVLSSYANTETKEDHTAGMCFGWIQEMIERVRNGVGRVDNTLYLHYGKQSLELKPPRVIADYPDSEGYPSSFFPILTIMCRNHDGYRPREDLRKEMEAKRVRRWKQASKPAEMIAVLIATAQQQAKRLVMDKSDGNRSGQATISPLLLWIEETGVRFVRAHVPVTYLEALSDPSKPLSEALVVEMTSPLDFLKENDQRQLLVALTALLDEYFRRFKPANLTRSVPISPDATDSEREFNGKPNKANLAARTASAKLLRTAEAQDTARRDPETKEITMSLDSGLTATT